LVLPNDQLPQNEEIGPAFRRSVRMYPAIAVRELIANALIHQDLSRRGAGPLVEIFENRVEISNPGLPLIETLRFIDEPPTSRNETLARFMRCLNLCEERGSGIDKVIAEIEIFQLPAPDFRTTSQSTVAFLYGPRQFAQMDAEERIRATYQHACLKYVLGERMTNASLRSRLGITQPNYSMVSRIIRDAVKSSLVKPHGGATSGKGASYLPFWA
jgi:ATP-dependent DNA helicase RecG